MVVIFLLLSSKGASKTKKIDKLIQTNKTDHIGLVFNNKKSWFSLRILKIGLISLIFNFFMIKTELN